MTTSIYAIYNYSSFHHTEQMDLFKSPTLHTCMTRTIKQLGLEHLTQQKKGNNRSAGTVVSAA